MMSHLMINLHESAFLELPTTSQTENALQFDNNKPDGDTVELDTVVWSSMPTDSMVPEVQRPQHSMPTSGSPGVV